MLPMIGPLPSPPATVESAGRRSRASGAIWLERDVVLAAESGEPSAHLVGSTRAPDPGIGPRESHRPADECFPRGQAILAVTAPVVSVHSAGHYRAAVS